MAKDYQMWIGGRWVPAESGQTLESLNPSTGEVVGVIPRGGAADADEAIQAARLAFDRSEWPELHAADRREILYQVARLIRESAAELAEIESRDAGKVIKETTFVDVPAAAGTFEHFAGLASELRGETIAVPEKAFSCTVREPVGVVAQMIPWNAPLMAAAWKLAPALAAGNTCILKPSEFASLGVLELGRILDRAGVPGGVVNIVTGLGTEVPGRLIHSPRVDMVSFTGRTSTGKIVLREAADTVKKLCLELGGKSPNLVFPDADVDAALGATLVGAFMHSGQICTAASRLLLHASIHDEFVQALVDRTRRLKVGDTLDPETDVGPVISREHQQSILRYIEAGVEEGARLVCGGGVPSNAELAKGFFVEPTIFDGVTPAMTIAREEIFGPVLSVLTFHTEEEAIEIANDTRYGLAGIVWSQNIKRAFKVAKAIRAGTVWVNTYAPLYNEAPFGGYKESGLGRELGKAGLEEYTQLKHLNIDLTDGSPMASSWYSV